MILAALLVVVIVMLLWIATLLRQLVGEMQSARLAVRDAATWSQAIHQLALTVRDQYFPLKY